MSTSQPAWIDPFDLAARLGTPDLVLAGQDVSSEAHADSLRVAFRLGIEGFFTISSVPTAAFLTQPELDRAAINDLHDKLWNQGLASLLIVLAREQIRIYSLWSPPLRQGHDVPDQDDRRLVDLLNLTTDALQARQLISSVESGRYFRMNPQKFDPGTRVDASLVANLRAAHQLLTATALPSEASRSLILQTVFISYLEDRHVIDEAFYRESLVEKGIVELKDLLRQGGAEALLHLFSSLRESFNGDLFYAPAAFQADAPQIELTSQHLKTLFEFRQGLVEMETGQGKFWPYDFAFIPIELISAIYDRFLNESDDERRALGAYYTPRFLADLVVDQAWNALSNDVKRSNGFQVLDPACGSAIFLVRMFQRLVEEWRRQHSGGEPSWEQLVALVQRLHGWDIQESAIRIGAFSLYVALLDQIEPRAIRALMQEGRFLPALIGRTLCQRNFLETEKSPNCFELIIGNPPWVSRNQHANASAKAYCSGRYPLPGGQLAWAFIYKSWEHVSPKGIVAFLLPAMGVLFNESAEAIRARSLWLTRTDVLRIINFADLRFQLFEGADRAAALAVYGLAKPLLPSGRTEYWVPKAGQLVGAARLLTIPTVDRTAIDQRITRTDPFVWKTRMWASGRDLKLLDWLKDLPQLSRDVVEFKESGRLETGELGEKWLIGQGFKPWYSGKPKISSTVTRYPFLRISQFRPWVLSTPEGEPWKTAELHRSGFEYGFLGPHILIPQGISTQTSRLRAAYVPESCTFQHSIQAVTFPAAQDARAKLLTAILNSKFASWFYFHRTSNFGVERPKVHQRQLLLLPFPAIDETPDPASAKTAQEQIVSLIDEMLARRNQVLGAENWLAPYVDRLDEHVFSYYGLTDEERMLVGDAVDAIIPSTQPSRETVTVVMRDTDEPTREAYGNTLLKALNRWIKPSIKVRGRLLTGSRDWAIIELELTQGQSLFVADNQSERLHWALDRAMIALPRGESRNFELRPDAKLFLDNKLYLVKPVANRFWLRSTALNDADEIAADLISLASDRKDKRQY